MILQEGQLVYGRAYQRETEWKEKWENNQDSVENSADWTEAGVTVCRDSLEDEWRHRIHSVWNPLWSSSQCKVKKALLRFLFPAALTTCPSCHTTTKRFSDHPLCAASSADTNLSENLSCCQEEDEKHRTPKYRRAESSCLNLVLRSLSRADDDAVTHLPRV